MAGKSCIKLTEEDRFRAEEIVKDTQKKGPEGKIARKIVTISKDHGVDLEKLGAVLDTLAGTLKDRSAVHIKEYNKLIFDIADDFCLLPEEEYSTEEARHKLDMLHEIGDLFIEKSKTSKTGEVGW